LKKNADALKIPKTWPGGSVSIGQKKGGKKRALSMHYLWGEKKNHFDIS